MSPTFTPTPQPPLAWNADGRIACPRHQPFGSTWGLEGWEAIPADVADEHDLACEEGCPTPQEVSA